jgi:hypothetical protein
MRQSDPPTMAHFAAPAHFVTKTTAAVHFVAPAHNVVHSMVFKINKDQCVGIYTVLQIRTTNVPTMKNMH